MATEVSIANLALSRLGETASISSLSPPEGSAEAQHCARWLPIARDTLLSMHAWSFATVRSRLALLTADDIYTSWDYVYARPNNCLRLLAVLPDGYEDEVLQAAEFACETDTDERDLILTDTEDAVAKWVMRVTNPTRYTPLFVEALSYMLASSLAGQLIKGEEGRKAAVDNYNAAVSLVVRAAGQDAGQTRVLDTYTPEWIADR